MKKTKIGIGMNRFDWVVKGHASGPNLTCDSPLLFNEQGVVIPSVGSLVPGWLLVVPRQQANSYAELQPGLRSSLFSLAQRAASKVSQWGPVIFLEHGATRPNSVTGCGVDQAHLHVVPTHADLLSRVLKDRKVHWEKTDGLDPWSSIPQNQEYYLISVGDHTFVGYPSAPVSQYFRKQLAQEIGLPNEWDYKGWPNYGNVNRTVEQFGRS